MACFRRGGVERRSESASTGENAVKRFGLRGATVEEVRGALDVITAGLSSSSSKQYVLRARAS
jgi:hypothetical protein